MDCLDAIYKDCGIEVGYLPVNTTYKLQVLDLVVNGPLKACIRRHRAKRLVEYFAKFKELYEKEQEKDEKDRETPKWDPPKPSMYQCIQDLMELMVSPAPDFGFRDPKFIKGVVKSFIDVGLAFQSEDDKTFIPYNDTSNAGTMDMKLKPSGTVMKYEHNAIELLLETQVNDEVMEENESDDQDDNDDHDEE